MPSGNLQGIHGGSKTPRDDTSIMDQRQSSVNHAGRKIRKITKEPKKPIFFGKHFPAELIDRIDQFLSLEEHVLFHRFCFVQLSKDYKKYSTAHQKKLTRGMANFKNLLKLTQLSPRLCNLALMGNNHFYGKYAASDSSPSALPALNINCISRRLRALDLRYIDCNAGKGKVNQLIASLTVLQRLTLDQCGFSGNLSFSALTQLRSLTVEWCATTASTNLSFSVLTNLESLTLTGSDFLTTWDLDLSPLTKLQVLKLKGRRLKGVKFPVTTQLESLTINGCKSLTSLDLTALTQLKFLAVKKCDSLSSLTLPVSTQLQSLTISCYALNRLDYPAYPNLKSLKLSYEQTKSLPLLATTQLQSLTITRGSLLTDLCLSVLTNLESLTLEWCNSLNSLDLSAFTQLRSFTSVGHSLNSLTLPRTTHSLILERCAYLDSLDFSVITSHLQSLTLVHCNSINSSDFPFFTNLRSLTIEPVMPNAKIQFQQCLPDFEISYDDESRILRASKKRVGDTFEV